MWGVAVRIITPVLLWLGRALGWLFGADLIAVVVRWIASIGCGIAGVAAVKGILGTVVSVSAIVSLWSVLPRPVFYMASVIGLGTGIQMMITVYVGKWMLKKIEETCKSFLATQIGPPKP